jgi:hypothetical protein
VYGRGVSSDVVRVDPPRTTSLDNTLTHNILSTSPQLRISQQALGTLPEDGIVMSKHLVDTIDN